MYCILRFILMLTVLLLAYLTVVVVYVVPYAWLVPVAMGVLMLFKKTHRYTAHGTARWAEAEDLEGMIDE